MRTPPYVSVLDGSCCVVAAVGPFRLDLWALGLGWRPDGTMRRERRPPLSETELAGLADRLRVRSLAFMGQSHGWPPSEVLRHLREKGLFSGEFTEITWGPEGFRLRRA